MEKKKKILYVITKSNFGGAQRYVYELATNIGKEYQVTVAFGGSGALKDKLKAANISTVEIKSFQRDINFFKELRALFEIWQLFRTENPDIIHLNSSKAIGIGTLVGRLTGIKHIVSTIHGWPFLEKRSFVWRSFAWFGAWISAMLSHSIIVVSKHDSIHSVPFITKKLYVLHTALPQIIFKDRNEARETLYKSEVIEAHENDIWLITNAELTQNKNLFVAIDAVIEYNKKAKRSIFYSIMSDGELRQELTEYIVKKKAGDFITLLGYIDNGRMYLKAFDLFLLPSKKEGLPYALLEAGAAGLPAIASNVGGIPEVISHRVNGLLIDPYAVASIENALETLIKNLAERKEFGETLQHKVSSEFNLEQMISKTTDLYTLRGE